MLDYTDYQMFRDDTFKLNETTFDLEMALNEIVELFDQEAKQKLLNLQTTLSPTMPHQICCDRQRIQQMMFSLISTAIESTYYGTINISVAFNTESEQLMISCTSDTGDCETYPGMMEINSSNDSEFVIYGDIGLSICNLICKSLGGELSEQKSNNGMGHTYSLTVKARNMDEVRVNYVARGGVAARSDHTFGQIEPVATGRFDSRSQASQLNPSVISVLDYSEGRNEMLSDSPEVIDTVSP